MDEEKVLSAAKAEAQRWIDGIKFDGKYDADKIIACLQIHHPKAKIQVVPGPKYVMAAIMDQAKVEYGDKAEEAVKELRPHECIWDWYCEAWYASAYASDEVERPEWFSHGSRYDAFVAGLGFMVNLDTLIVCVPRPEAYRDEQLRLHRADGPAIIWDDEEQYWWHGIRIDEKFYLHRDKLTAKDVTGESNQETKRAICELLGWEFIGNLVGLKLVQKDDYGELLETASLKDDEKKPARFCRVKCPSTGRVYMLRVPPGTKTCHEGLASCAAVKQEEYDFDVET